MLVATELESANSEGAKRVLRKKKKIRLIKIVNALVFSVSSASVFLVCVWCGVVWGGAQLPSQGGSAAGRNLPSMFVLS